jgi:methylaspartate mutase sigma subunit
VANRLIDLALTQAGYRVINLGPCTPVSDFVECFAAHPEALAVAIGSLNGHAVEDLAPLRAARDSGVLNCPVIVGGNVCVGEQGRAASIAALRALGVDYVLGDLAELLALLGRLSAGHTPRAELRPTPVPVP